MMTSTVQAESLADITPAPKTSLAWRVASAALSGGTAAGEAWAQPASVANAPPLLVPATPSDPTEQAIATATQAKLLALSNPTQDLSRGLLLELYGSWPVNVIALARDPAGYLDKAGVGSPYVMPWGDVWRKKEVVDLLSVRSLQSLFSRIQCQRIFGRPPWRVSCLIPLYCSPTPPKNSTTPRSVHNASQRRKPLRKRTPYGSAPSYPAQAAPPSSRLQRILPLRADNRRIEPHSATPARRKHSVPPVGP